MGGYKATCDMSINLCAPGTAYKATQFCRNILGEIVEMKGEGVSLTPIRPLTLHMGKNAFFGHFKATLTKKCEKNVEIKTKHDVRTLSEKTLNRDHRWN